MLVLHWTWKRKLRSILDLMDSITVYDEVWKRKRDGMVHVLWKEVKAVRRGTIIDDVTKIQDLKRNKLNAMSTFK